MFPIIKLIWSGQ